MYLSRTQSPPSLALALPFPGTGRMNHRRAESPEFDPAAHYPAARHPPVLATAVAAGPVPDTDFSAPAAAPDTITGPVLRAVEAFNAGRCAAGKIQHLLCRAIRLCATDWPVAMRCLALLDRSRDPVTGRPIRPDIKVFNTAITSSGKAYRATMVMRWFTEAIARDIPLDHDFYRSAILSCRFCHAPDLALALLRHLLDNRHASGVEPSTIVFNITMSALKQAGEHGEVLRLFDHMLREQARGGFAGPDSVSYNTVIASLGRIGLPLPLWVLDSLRRMQARAPRAAPPSGTTGPADPAGRAPASGGDGP